MMLLDPYRFAAAVATTAWNPSDKGTNVVLSNGNLTCINAAGTWQGVRCTVGKSSGYGYFEITAVAVTGNTLMVGVADSGFTINGFHLGQSSASTKKSLGYYNFGTVYQNLTNAYVTSTIASYGNGAVIGVAVDFSNNTTRVYNGATGALLGTFFDTSPWTTLYPAASVISNGSCTLNATGPFAYLPSGAVAWDSASAGAWPVSSSSTWNPSDKHADIALSHGNLMALKTTSGSGFIGLRGMNGKSSGLRYFTMTVPGPGRAGTSNQCILGIADANYTLAGGYLGQHTSSAFKKSVGLQSATTILYYNMTAAAGNNSSTPGSYTDNTILGVLVDFSTFTISWYNDATGALLATYVDTGPWTIPMFPAASFRNNGGCMLECLGPFLNLPAGASVWDAP